MAFCDNISHYMEKVEELFQKYLSGFVGAVWSLLVVASGSLSRERLTVTYFKFLTIVSTSVHRALFAGDEILQQITQSIEILRWFGFLVQMLMWFILMMLVVSRSLC